MFDYFDAVRDGLLDRTCRAVDDGKDLGYIDLVLGFDGIVTLVELSALSEKIAVVGILKNRNCGGRIRTEGFKRCWDMQMH